MCKFFNLYISLSRKCWVEIRICTNSFSITGTKTQVWIIGSSFVHWPSAYAKGRPENLHLGLENTAITWIGRRGMPWQDFDRTIQERLKTKTPPNFVIVQLGSNDIMKVKSLELINNIQCSMLMLKALCPNTRIIWSDMLPRIYWHGAKKPARVDLARKRVNRAIKSFLLKYGGISS